MPKILKALVGKLTDSAPQSATFIPFMTPIPATSHLDLLILRPEKWDIMSKLFKTSVVDFSFWKKQVLSSAYAVYRKSLLQTLKLLISGFFFILMNAISKKRMKR